MPDDRRHDGGRDEDRYFDLKGLSEYSGLSVRTLQRHMVDSIHPLPHHRVRAAPTARGRVLVRKRDYDAWIAHYRADAPAASAPGDVSWIRRGLRVEK